MNIAALLTTPLAAAPPQTPALQQHAAPVAAFASLLNALLSGMSDTADTADVPADGGTIIVTEDQPAYAERRSVLAAALPPQTAAPAPLHAAPPRSSTPLETVAHDDVVTQHDDAVSRHAEPVSQHADAVSQHDGMPEHVQPVTGSTESAAPAEDPAAPLSVAALSTVMRTTRAAPVDTSRLEPQLVERVGRVVQRMRDEFGHEVRIVEGWRSQERQNTLFEQGRTAPGNVVTWTRNSQHTHGRAVDVMIDGSYANPAAYARLGEVAAEEGLRTLGPKDPGHLELAGPRPERGGSTHTHGMRAMHVASSSGGIARPAPAAAVARVARVAAVGGHAAADVQRAPALSPHASAFPQAPAAAQPVVAAPDAANASPSAPATALHHATDTLEPALAARTVSTSMMDTAPRVASPAMNATATVPAPATQAPSRTRDDVPTESSSGEGAGTVRMERPTPFAAPAPRAEGIVQTVAPLRVDQVARVMDVVETMQNATPHQLRLQLTEAEGGGSIHVNLRGNVVGATIETSDAALAADLNRNMRDLRAALQTHGLETSRVFAREAAAAVVAAPEAASVVETPAGQRGSGSSTSDPRSRHEGGERRQDAQQQRERQQQRRNN